MNELYEILFLSYSIPQMIGYSIFFIFGIFMYSYLEVDNRDKSSKNTPTKFNWKFFYKDNLKRYLATILVVYISFRFFVEITGNPLDEFTAFLLGFTGDGIVGMNKKKLKQLQYKREEFIN